MRIALFILGLCFVFFSCKDAEKTKLLTEINEMESQLDSMEVLAEKSKIDTLFKITNRIKANIAEVSKYYTADTINYEAAKLMNLYKQSMKALSSNSGNIAKVRNSIPEVREKLADLKFDIEHGVGNRESYTDYVDFEREKVKQIGEILEYYIETKNKFIGKYLESDPKVVELIKKLKDEEE